MADATTPGRWPLHPGDWVIAQSEDGVSFRVLAQSASDIEAQRILKRYQEEGAEVFAFKFVGAVP